MQPDIPLGRPVVLIVDDTPDNLAMLSSALVAAGYAVLVALDGASALERIARLTPDVILLDAIMPGMDGFETCERIKDNVLYKHIPVIFMTALADTQHVVNGFRVGGVDYVTKPIRPDEVVARIAAHVRRAASQRHADIVLELSSRAAVIASANGDVQWHSALAPSRLAHFYAGDGRADDGDVAAIAGPLTRLPGVLASWLFEYASAPGEDRAQTVEILPSGERLVARIAGAANRGAWIVIFEEHADGRDTAELVLRFGLTQREAEVLLWLSRGKTNRDISEILGMAARTVNKHLEHIFDKLNVETRTAAAAVALNGTR
jgi:DNA-binding NarL/FixJ family response regulator